MLIGLYLICSLEKINGDLYDFSTNKKVLKQPVDVWLPCHPITHPNLQEIKLKALFKGEEDWVYHNWTLFVSWWAVALLQNEPIRKPRPSDEVKRGMNHCDPSSYIIIMVCYLRLDVALWHCAGSCYNKIEGRYQSCLKVTVEKDLNCLPVLGMGLVCFCFETMHIFFIVLPGFTFLSSEWESRNSLIEWRFENSVLQ